MVESTTQTAESTAAPPGARYSFHEIKSPASPRLVFCGLFVLWLALVPSVNVGGDTWWYVEDIRVTLARPWDSAPIWNFAHLIWRPLGRILAMLFLPLVSPMFGNDAHTSITFLLMAVNTLAALVGGLLLQSAIWKMTGKPWFSTFAAMAFLFFNSVLNFSRTGSPYVVALVLSIGALYAAVFCGSSTSRAVTAGILSGLAAVCWIPYSLSLPAVALARPILAGVFPGPATGKDGKAESPWRFAAIVALSCGCVAAFFYGMAAVEAHVNSVAALRAWIAASSQDVRDRTALRMVTGIVRSLYHLGNYAVWLKWYVFHDKYANVGIADLMRGAILRLPLFYAALAALTWYLRRSAEGKRLLLLLAIFSVPHIALALAYESGDPSRYMAPLGALVICAAFVIADARNSLASRIAVAALFCAPIPANLLAMAGHNEAIAHDVQRMQVLGTPSPANHVYVISNYDTLFELKYGSPLNPINRGPQHDLLTIIPFGDQSKWPQKFACDASNAWNSSGRVWVTVRVLADRPIRNWFWIEGDVGRLRWGPLHEFFTRLDRGEVRDAKDGFFLVADTERNRQLLAAEVPGSGFGNCLDAREGRPDSISELLLRQ